MGVDRQTLGCFDRSPNALNLVRLLLAVEVVAWHAHALRGGDLPAPLRLLVSDIGVDAFFAISGLLICRAWVRRPELRPFVVARARRLLPGLWVCLLVTGLVIVPVACWLGGRQVPSPAAGLDYALANAGIRVGQWTIGDTTAGLHDVAWNGSLWTLSWEVYCYVAVATLGVVGLLRGRVVLGAAVVAWVVTVSLEILGVVPNVGPEVLWMTWRAGLMFAVGAALWCWRDRVRLDGRLALMAVGTIVLGVVLLDNYRVLGAPALAYLCFYVAIRLGRHPRLVVRRDLSYGTYIYAFPLQQALIVVGLGSLPWALFVVASLACVLPVALASWHWVESPAMRWRRADRPSRDVSRRATGSRGRGSTPTPVVSPRA